MLVRDIRRDTAFRNLNVVPFSRNPAAILSSVHELADGTSVHLRLTRPSDAPRVREFLQEVPDDAVRHFTFYEPSERLMLAAAAPYEGTEALVGLADLAMLETGVAEIALVVRDDHQGKGVGTLMSEAAASLAKRRAATHLKATMAADNEAMLKLMQRLGDTVVTREGETLVAYTRLEEPRSVPSAA